MSGLPDVLTIGGFPIATLALTAIGGLLVGYLAAGLRQRQAPTAAAGARDLIFNMALGVLLGAKLIYLLLHPIDYWRTPGLLLLFPYGPLALPGALLGAAIGGWLTLWRRSDRRLLLDEAAAPLALAVAIALAGNTAPGSWAYAPLLGAAAVVGLVTRRQTATASLPTAQVLVLSACAVVLADLARPAAGTVAGISAIQLGAALAGTAAWFWSRRLTATPNQ